MTRAGTLRPVPASLESMGSGLSPGEPRNRKSASAPPSLSEERAQASVQPAGSGPDGPVSLRVAVSAGARRRVGIALGRGGAGLERLEDRAAALAAGALA